MTTATTESLFIKKQNPNDLFEKSASIARMPDDDRKWPETVLSELHKQLPFLSGMDVSLNFTRIQPEAGYGFGYAIVRGQKNAVSLPTPKSENQLVKIPIVVSDRHLEPFHVFIFESRTIPLTQSRFEQALENPRVFAGPSSTPKTQKSLIDQLYPPYQQRQGFGKVVGGVGSGGINKLAKAVEEMTPEQIERLAKLKRYEKLDKARSSLTRKDRIVEEKDALVQGGIGGSILGAGRHAFKTQGSGVRGMAKGMLGSALLGAGTGTAVSLAGQQAKRMKARSRKKDRKSATYKEHFKEATVEDIPNFRAADSSDINCGTCDMYGSSTEMGTGVCNKYSTDVKEAMVCDSWSANHSAKTAGYRKYLMGARR